MGTHPECPTCICGRRAPVQRDQRKEASIGPGTVSWAEHLEGWAAYAGRYGSSQSAERIAERGGFGFFELWEFLGHKPTTWEPYRGG